MSGKCCLYPVVGDAFETVPQRTKFEFALRGLKRKISVFESSCSTHDNRLSISTESAQETISKKVLSPVRCKNTFIQFNKKIHRYKFFSILPHENNFFGTFTNKCTSQNCRTIFCERLCYEIKKDKKSRKRMRNRVTSASLTAR
ncbi:unnamed protein product [Oikopleura dioica]|uniref:Uncharacterized protein n=1 Tax=Oikopleura dioica TaxID=34765 RepID=E4X2D9_OIKDI|nr:unnamed protein product [Oikopleura dioica]